MSHCEMWTHPVQEYEYRVVTWLASANTPRWDAVYFSKLDKALDVVVNARANGNETVRLEECTWREVQC